MKFDTVIIGGGLCGLVAGIKLAEQKKNVAIISSGQSALHFCSGGFGLLGNTDGKKIDNPLDGIDNLNDKHPYRVIGKSNIQSLANEAKELMARAGIETYGLPTKNHSTLTPFGLLKSSWLTFEGYYSDFDNNYNNLDNVLIVAVKGFLECYPSFIADNLTKNGKKCRIESIEVSCISKLRSSNFDMRTPTVAKHISSSDIAEIAAALNELADNGETILFPAIIGIESFDICQLLIKSVKNPIYFIPTLPVSIAGLRTQNKLQRRFELLGGTLLHGDKATCGIIENSEIKGIQTENLSDDVVVADSYIIANGFLFGEGIVATPYAFSEPIFGLDTYANDNRETWYSHNFFGKQPYMNFGIEFDENFHPLKDGKAVKNMYAAGSILAHCNSLKEESGGGVAILSALKVAENICRSN